MLNKEGKVVSINCVKVSSVDSRYIHTYFKTMCDVKLRGVTLSFEGLKQFSGTE